MTRPARCNLFLGLVCMVLVPLCILTGSVAISPSDVWEALVAPGDNIQSVIIWESRLPATFTALFAGMALALAGLGMQTIFRNPLAGPSILGVSAGASLGAGMVLMTLGGAAATAFPALAGALAGALAVTMVLVAFSSALRSGAALLIVGILISYLTSSVISLLNFFADAEGIRAFVLWGLGNFSSSTPAGLWTMGICTLAALAVMCRCSGQLNAFLLGEETAATSGVNTMRLRTVMLLIAGLLTAAITAWCGPIGFLGLVAPHIARLLGASADHRHIIPSTALCGGAMGLLCLFLANIPATMGLGVIPINAITPVIGVPVILYLIARRKKIFYL